MRIIWWFVIFVPLFFILGYVLLSNEMLDLDDRLGGGNLWIFGIFIVSAIIAGEVTKPRHGGSGFLFFNSARPTAIIVTRNQEKKDLPWWLYMLAFVALVIGINYLLPDFWPTIMQWEEPKP